MKKYICILLFSFFLFSAKSQTPSWSWAKGAGGTLSDSVTASITDLLGNTYVVGHFLSPTITFGTITLVNASSTGSSQDAFVVKYSLGGAVVWAKKISGIYNEYANDVCINSAGEICVAGSFDSPTIIFETFSSSSPAPYHMFYAKYTTAGMATSCVSINGWSFSEIKYMTTDEFDNVYLAGNYSGSLSMTGPTTINSMGSGNDIFVAKLNSAGNEVWLKSIGGVDEEYCKGLSLDSLKNVVVAGTFASSVIGVESFMLNNDSVGMTDLFIARYNSSGTATWAKSPDGYFPNYNYGLITDAIGNTYITGSFQDSAVVFDGFSFVNTDTTASTGDVFLAKYDTVGTVAWVNTLSGEHEDVSNVISKDKNGNVYIAGGFYSPALSFLDTTLTNFASDTTADLFVAKYNSLGVKQWVITTGGAGNDLPMGVGVSTSGNVYVAGAHTSPSISFGTTVLTSSFTNWYDVFTARIFITAPPVGIEMHSFENNVFVFPNPSNGIFNFTGLENESAILITDISGRIIQNIVSTDRSYSLDLTGYGKGVYFYKITNHKTETQTGKMILVE